MQRSISLIAQDDFGFAREYNLEHECGKLHREVIEQQQQAERQSEIERRQRAPALLRVNESEIIRGTFAAASLKLGAKRRLAAIFEPLHQPGAD